MNHCQPAKVSDINSLKYLVHETKGLDDDKNEETQKEKTTITSPLFSFKSGTNLNNGGDQQNDKKKNEKTITKQQRT